MMRREGYLAKVKAVPNKRIKLKSTTDTKTRKKKKNTQKNTYKNNTNRKKHNKKPNENKHERTTQLWRNDDTTEEEETKYKET